jgi:hypothetical protein
MEFNHQTGFADPSLFSSGSAPIAAIVKCQLRFFTFYFIKFLPSGEPLLRKEHTCRLALCK